MDDSSRHLRSLTLLALLGLAGCSGPPRGEAHPAAPAPPREASAPSPAQDDGIPPEHLDAVLKEYYRGLGLIERHDFEKAAVAFARARELAPRWIPGWINLAIALMNQPDSEGARALQLNPAGQALRILNEVIERDPGNPHAHYCRGLIYEQRHLLAPAHDDFRAVTEKAPGDGHAWYWLGSTVETGQPLPGGRGKEPRPSAEGLDEMIADLRRALQCNPYLHAALYKLSWAYRSRGDPDEQRKLLNLWKQLDGGPDGIREGEEVRDAYVDQGRYAQVISPPIDRDLLSNPFRRPRFAPPAPARVPLADGERWVASSDFAGRLAAIGRARARLGAPIVALDADGDGRTDLFLPAAIIGPGGIRDALLLNRGEGSFEDASRRLGIPGDRASLGAAAGDFDGDGRADLVVTGIGEIHLLHNEGPAGFKDVTQAAGLSSPPALTLTARWLDLDQDGDLDLYLVNGTGLNHINRAFTEDTPPGFPDALFRNDGLPEPGPGASPPYWAPRAMAPHPEEAKGGLSIRMTPWVGPDAPTGGESPHTGMALLDLDDDHDMDLILTHQGAAPLALLNDRLGRFHATTIPGLGPHDADGGLLAADLDGDGRADLVTMDSSGKVAAWLNRSRRTGADLTIALEPMPCDARGWSLAMAADVDLDGRPDLLGVPTSAERPIVAWARNDGRRLHSRVLASDPDDREPRSLLGATLADLAGDPLPDLVLIPDGDAPRLARNLGNGHHWLALNLVGRWHANRYRRRTNPHGIGAKICLLGPGLDVSHPGTFVEAGLAQSCAPMILGLGTSESAAVLRVLWPDAHRQCELDVPADGVWDLVEQAHEKSGLRPRMPSSLVDPARRP